MISRLVGAIDVVYLGYANTFHSVVHRPLGYPVPYLSSEWVYTWLMVYNDSDGRPSVTVCLFPFIPDDMPMSGSIPHMQSHIILLE